MVGLMDKSTIIKLKEQGYSNRKVEKMLKINRKTIAKYWNEYVENVQKLSTANDTLKVAEIQETITSAPKYNTKSRMRRKLTDDFFIQLKSILDSEEEKKYLKPTKPPLELANIKESVVNKYSFVQIENNFYSVPEYLVGFKVISKIYYNKILIYSNNEFVCEHKKIDGIKKISADIRFATKNLTHIYLRKINLKNYKFK